MHRPRTTYHRLTDWLLVLAIALAPLQGAFSAYGDTCVHESSLVATNTGGHATGTGSMAGHENAGAGSVQDCCQQDCTCSGCAGTCNLTHASSFLPPSKLIPFSNSYNNYEPQYMAFYIGRAVPTLFRPPRTSV